MSTSPLVTPSATTPTTPPCSSSSSTQSQTSTTTAKVVRVKEQTNIHPSQTTTNLTNGNTSKESSENVGIEDLDTAYDLIEAREFDKARSLLEKLIPLLEENKESSLFQLAQGYFRIALTYPKLSFQSDTHLLQAKKILNEILTKLLGMDLSPAANSKDYQILRSSYLEIASLLSTDLVEEHEEIVDKIKTCLQQIPPLDDFYEILDEAQNLFNEGIGPNEINEIRETVKTALSVLSGDAPDVILAKAWGHIFIAETFPVGNNERNENSALALDFALSAYAAQKDFFLEYHKIDIYRYFKQTFSKLKKLLPENEKIEAPYQECYRLYTFYKNHPAGDPWKASRVFALLALAAAAIVVAVVLGRRLITKLNTNGLFPFIRNSSSW